MQRDAPQVVVSGAAGATAPAWLLACLVAILAAGRSDEVKSCQQVNRLIEEALGTLRLHPEVELLHVCPEANLCKCRLTSVGMYTSVACQCQAIS